MAMESSIEGLVLSMVARSSSGRGGVLIDTSASLWGGPSTMPVGRIVTPTTAVSPVRTLAQRRTTVLLVDDSLPGLEPSSTSHRDTMPGCALLETARSLDHPRPYSGATPSVGCVLPTVPEPGRDVEIDLEVVRGAHLLGHQRLDLVTLPGRDLEYQLVVHLQQHA